ncbi:MAG: hypothetical protein WBW74_06820, partial [Xanthobacteraceae bacterium]
MRKRKREPRPPIPTNLIPASYTEAVETEIIATVDHWYGLMAAVLGSEAGHLAVQNDLYRQLLAGDCAALDVATIVAMADGGHAPADHALRTAIHAHIDTDRFGELPVQLRAYAQRALTRPPLPIGYPSRGSQVVNDFTRDIAIPVLIDQTVARWPAVPMLYSSRSRHSVAWFVALVFTRHGITLSERQVRRIYEARRTLARRLAEF